MATSRFSQTEIDHQKAVLAGPHRWDAASGKYVSTGEAPKPSGAPNPNSQVAILAGPHHWEAGRNGEQGRYVADAPAPEPAKPAPKPAKK